MKPMLAVEVDFQKLKYPCYVQPKLDGIRVVIKDGQVLSRSLKPIRNEYVQKLFSGLDGIDGELIVGDPLAPDVFQKTTSGVMSKEGEPDVTLYVFDVWDSELPYEERLVTLSERIGNHVHCKVVGSVICSNEQSVMDEANRRVTEGYEGVMLRSPEKVYKYGRATKNSQELLKWKPFEDDEFRVVGFVERMHNANEATVNALGYVERSSSKEGKVPMDTLGALVLQWNENEVFECGTGFTDAQRKEIWDNKEAYLGSLAKIRYQAIGMKDKPRFPSFLGFRHPDDIS